MLGDRSFYFSEGPVVGGAQHTSICCRTYRACPRTFGSVLDGPRTDVKVNVNALRKPREGSQF